MENRVYASLRDFAKKLEMGRQSSGSYLPTQTPNGESYSEIIKRATKTTRETPRRQ
jgi:hypothetical protein